MPSGLFYLQSLDRSIPIKGASNWFLLLPCFIEIPVFHANSIDPDQTPPSTQFAKCPFYGTLALNGLTHRHDSVQIITHMLE